MILFDCPFCLISHAPCLLSHVFRYSRQIHLPVETSAMRSCLTISRSGDFTRQEYFVGKLLAYILRVHCTILGVSGTTDMKSVVLSGSVWWCVDHPLVNIANVRTSWMVQWNGMLMMEARLEDNGWEILNNQLTKAETEWTWIWIWIANFVARFLHVFVKPNSNWPNKYNTFPKWFINQLAWDNGKECLNCQLEMWERMQQMQFQKIRGEHSSKIHFAN